ncbi:hypothetical protein C6376_30695 [Streptomyces sp. P3]|uniref:hypothetical protein n=1 Tax=Streptomyces sp. P3 TaxID=2135430 RepID=UPI000D1B9094|nr:hypothetical protein [Streptomyces sp. P3]AVV45114.1 hypothetical protein C6376_30695 [Streptomyces sp. P3]
MTAPEPTDPESIWLKFLNDSEEAIRRSAPREPSAQERLFLRGSAPVRQADSVGALWQPDDDWPGPAWQDLSTRERVRRGLRALGAVVAVVALLGIFSWLPRGAPGLSEEQNTPTAGQSENIFEPPTAEGALPSPLRPRGGDE